MKKNLSMIFLASIFVMVFAHAQAQGKFSMHAGLAIPVMDFGSGDIEDEDAGGAALGLNLGLQYVYPLTESGLGLFGGIDFTYNGLQKSIKDDSKELYELLGINGDITFYKYINIPISAGLNFTHQANENTAIFANAGMVFNMLKITDMVIEMGNVEATTEIDMATNLGAKLGGGIIFNNKYSVALNYLALGTHNLEGRVSFMGMFEDVEGKGKVDMLTLTLGFHF